jgi:hypothetical protein
LLQPPVLEPGKNRRQDRADAEHGDQRPAAYPAGSALLTRLRVKNVKRILHNFNRPPRQERG